MGSCLWSASEAPWQAAAPAKVALAHKSQMQSMQFMLEVSGLCSQKWSKCLFNLCFFLLKLWKIMYNGSFHEAKYWKHLYIYQISLFQASRIEVPPDWWRLLTSPSLCVHRLTGFQVPPPVTSTGSVFSLRLTSDFAVSAHGFKLNYEGQKVSGCICVNDALQRRGVQRKNEQRTSTSVDWKEATAHGRQTMSLYDSKAI